MQLVAELFVIHSLPMWGVVMEPRLTKQATQSSIKRIEETWVWEITCVGRCLSITNLQTRGSQKLHPALTHDIMTLEHLQSEEIPCIHVQRLFINIWFLLRGQHNKFVPKMPLNNLVTFGLVYNMGEESRAPAERKALVTTNDTYQMGFNNLCHNLRVMFWAGKCIFTYCHARTRGGPRGSWRQGADAQGRTCSWWALQAARPGKLAHQTLVWEHQHIPSSAAWLAVSSVELHSTIREPSPSCSKRGSSYCCHGTFCTKVEHHRTLWRSFMDATIATHLPALYLRRREFSKQRCTIRLPVMSCAVSKLWSTAEQIIEEHAQRVYQNKNITTQQIPYSKGARFPARCCICCLSHSQIKCSLFKTSTNWFMHASMNDSEHTSSCPTFVFLKKNAQVNNHQHLCVSNVESWLQYLQPTARCRSWLQGCTAGRR